ncbi:MAG TPA: ATPase [Spirochaetaceae bacterium]|nr:ATPase [Spirochaetaceae bacterium]
MKERIYFREKYLARLRPFYDSDVVKVITGIRRCGKSFILKSVIEELKGKVSSERIIHLPLDARGFNKLETPEDLENAISALIESDERHYIFIDEVQNIAGFEKTVLAFQEEGHSIFLSGSNSYLLSDDISTKLTGRYLNFEILTLDFREYVEMKRFFGKKTGDLQDEFEKYMLNGGFPKSLEFDGDEAVRTYVKGIIGEIFHKDVSVRHRVSGMALYERIQSFVIGNYSSAFSLSSLYDNLVKEGIGTKIETVRKYIRFLEKAKIIYECNRFDLKSKRALKREQKYYLADLSISFSMSVDNRLNLGKSLENLVFMYFLGKNYEVSIGKIGDLECDFIIRKTDGDYAYVQVAYSLQAGDERSTEELQEREYRPFRLIRDSYPCYIITLDRFAERRDGVRHINAIDLLFGKSEL